MSLLAGFWQFLNTDVRDMPWGELAETGIDSIAATNDFAEALKEQAPNIKQLQPYLQQVEPFLKVLDAPVTQLAIAGLPFVSIGIGLLRIYLEKSQIEPTYESAVTVAAQLAYLQSLERVLQAIADDAITAKLEQVSLEKLVGKQLQSLAGAEITTAEAKKITSRFRESEFAKQFNQALTEQLIGAGLDNAYSQRLVERVMWGTPRFLSQAIAEAGEAVQPLAEFYRTGGQQVQERFESINAYLEKEIASLPDEPVFDERDPKICFRDIYVPLKVQPLTQAGNVDRERKTINIHQWAMDLLEQSSDQPRKVMFVEGDAGRGKSVFCRMFADLVRRELEFSYIPLVVRLRKLRHVDSNLQNTLTNHAQLAKQTFIAAYPGWLANINTRFLIILDGFDELLLEGRATGGLKDFLQQVVDFQEDSHHQCIVTGRPLALQGMERLITQTENLERVRLEPMDDDQREQWLGNWQRLFGAEEVEKFRAFIKACPNDIQNSLAREPLLIYLLARLHREGDLTSDMFAGTEEGIQAKIRVYRESVRWVLEKQREDQNLRLSGLDNTDDLLKILRETALCVVQSGNEIAQLSMLKNRFGGSNTKDKSEDEKNPLAQLLKISMKETEQSEDKALNKLLTTFYLNPREGDRHGSVEFTHKSFGEYLFAERLISAFVEWTEVDKYQEFRISKGTLHWQIYDLLGYGGLSVEIVEYLLELLRESEIDQVKLFERLHEFYWLWAEGEFLDREPSDNFPQKKMLQLKKQEVETGLKQVDIYTGLNVMILLFRLHAAAQPENYPNLTRDDSKPVINFHPCGEINTDSFNNMILQKIIYYSDSLGVGTFAKYVGLHLFRANLEDSQLFNTNLFNADLSNSNLLFANLSNANLFNVNLSNAKLICTELCRAHLLSTNLSNANLANAKLANANLSNANLTNTNFSEARISEANLSGANLSNANFSKANLSSSNFFQANLSGANLSKADVSNTNLSKAKLLSTKLIQTNLQDANLFKANLYNAELEEARLYNANLSQTRIERTSFRNAKLKDVNMKNSEIQNANLSNTYLENTNFSNANIRNVNFYNANLKNLNLESAYMEDVKFYSANLKGVNFSNSVLLKVDLRYVRHLTLTQLNLDESPPLICGVLLSSNLGVDVDRDWDRLASVLDERYSIRFRTIEEAEEWVNERRPK